VRGVDWTLTGVGELVVLVCLAVQELDLQIAVSSQSVASRLCEHCSKQSGRRGERPFFVKGHGNPSGVKSVSRIRYNREQTKT
jgi:hypothetical protein